MSNLCRDYPKTAIKLKLPPKQKQVVVKHGNHIPWYTPWYTLWCTLFSSPRASLRTIFVHINSSTLSYLPKSIAMVRKGYFAEKSILCMSHYPSQNFNMASKHQVDSFREFPDSLHRFEILQTRPSGLALKTRLF